MSIFEGFEVAHKYIFLWIQGIDSMLHALYSVITKNHRILWWQLVLNVLSIALRACHKRFFTFYFHMGKQRNAFNVRAYIIRYKTIIVVHAGLLNRGCTHFIGVKRVVSCNNIARWRMLAWFESLNLMRKNQCLIFVWYRCIGWVGWIVLWDIF